MEIHIEGALLKEALLSVMMVQWEIAFKNFLIAIFHATSATSEKFLIISFKNLTFFKPLKRLHLYNCVWAYVNFTRKIRYISFFF